MVEPYCSNFRIVTAIFKVSEYLGILRYQIIAEYLRVLRYCRLRGQYGTDTLKNALHGSSNPEHAMSTIQKIFGELYFNKDGTAQGTPSVHVI